MVHHSKGVEKAIPCHSVPGQRMKRSLGFSRVDVVVVSAVVLLLALLFLVIRREDRGRAALTDCFSHLINLHGTQDLFVQERGAWVTALSTNEGGTKEVMWEPKAARLHFLALFPDPMYPKGCFTCPFDIRESAGRGTLQNSNISYFLSLNVDLNQPLWVLAGTRNISLKQESILAVTAGATNRWHPRYRMHGEAGYLLFLNGHIAKSSNAIPFPIPPGATNYLILP